jgi:hypothetical protein
MFERVSKFISLTGAEKEQVGLIKTPKALPNLTYRGGKITSSFE